MPEWFRQLAYFFLGAVMVLIMIFIAGGILIVGIISIREWIQDWQIRKRRRNGGTMQ